MQDAPLEGAPLIAPSSTEHPLYDAAVEACRSVYDPEIPVNIYDLGLIYTIDIDAENQGWVVPRKFAADLELGVGWYRGWVQRT